MIEEIFIGDEVVCDFCNDDYTDSEDRGGFLIGSYAVCPKCAEKYRADYPVVDERCRDDETFKQFVMRIRNGNNSIFVGSTDEFPF